MPVTANWDIRRAFAELPLPKREAWIATLNEAVGQIEATIPADQHYGAIRWGRALTLLTTTS